MAVETIHTVDCEPKWTDIVRLWKNMDSKIADKHIYDELQKMAAVCDIVRQAQKNGQKLLFDNGKFKEVA